MAAEPIPSTPHPARPRKRWRIDAAGLCTSPATAQLLRDASVWGTGDRVEGAGRRIDAPTGGERVVSRVEGLLLPGFINAHAHIELSCLHGKIAPRHSFTEWLQEIVGLKRREVIGNPAGARAAAIVALRDLVSRGCVWLGDIVSTGIVSEGGWIHVGAVPAGELYLEMIDFREEHAPEMVAATAARALESGGAVAPLLAGLSPHAPYTTTPALLAETARLARQHGFSTCIHLAETAEEVEMLQHGTGAMVDFLRGPKVLPPEWRAPGCGPVELLMRTGFLQQRSSAALPALLVHCNALRDAEIATLRDYAACMIVCPGTHRYFARGEFPLGKALAAGLPAALGTDGLSSNESLDMLREAAIACELTPSLDAATALSLITDRAADALGPAIAGTVGRIVPGALAAFAEITAIDSAPGSGFLESQRTLANPALREALVGGRLRSRIVLPD